ncbi:MAG: Smr/MutS family protein [Myxococcaceae bacterium]|nr:Smr/MutS family protein [Myxococcaceae bacterium]
MAKDKPFNNPFGALKAQAKPEKAAPAATKPAQAPPQPAKKKGQQVDVDAESAEFLSAMGAFDEVKPVREPPRPEVTAAQKQQAAADDAEALLELAELVVDPDAELVVEQGQTSVRAYPQGFDVKLLGRMRAKAELNVMALGGEQARQALERFIVDSQLKGLRAVRVVTAPEQRELAVTALTKGRLTRKVLAVSGGADGLDVLLRR